MWLQQLGCPKKPQQVKITQLTLVHFLICSYICLCSPCVGREDPGLFQVPGCRRDRDKNIRGCAQRRGGESSAHWHQPGRGSETFFSTGGWLLLVAQLCSYPAHRQPQHLPAQNAHVLWTDLAWPWDASGRMLIFGERQGTAIYWELDTFKMSLCDQNLQCSKSLANVM